MTYQFCLHSCFWIVLALYHESFQTKNIWILYVSQAVLTINILSSFFFFPSIFQSIFQVFYDTMSKPKEVISSTCGGGGLVTKLCLTLMTPRTVACQSPLSMGFSRQEYWSGLPFPFPGNVPNPGIESGSPALQAYSLPTTREALPPHTLL